MAQLCSDIGFTKPHDVASAKILAGDKWLDRLHQRGAEEGHHATFMETSCFEINFSELHLTRHRLRQLKCSCIPRCRTIVREACEVF